MADEGQLTNGTGDTEEQAIDLDGAEEEEVVDRSPNIGLNMYSTLQPEEDARPAAIAADSESPLFVSEGSPSATSEDIGVALDEEAVRRNGIAVIVPPVQNGWEYRRYDELPVATEILENYDDGGLVEYLVRFDDESEEVLTFDELLQLEDGPTLLAVYDHQVAEVSDSVESAPDSSSRQTRRSKDLRKTHITTFTLSSDDELTTSNHSVRRGRPRARPFRSQRKMDRSSRSTRARNVNYYDTVTLEELSGEIYRDGSSDDNRLRKKKRTSVKNSAPSQTKRLLLRGPRRNRSPSSSYSASEAEVRRSGRNVGSRNMRELGEDEIPEQLNMTNSTPKFVGAKEHFKRLPEDHEFRQRHSEHCDVCYKTGDDEEKGPLTYCQGCTISYHQQCLGPRNGRDHLVTKIGRKDFVLQCRRCIGVKKDPMAPDLGLCSACREPGESTNPFRERKTPQQEQKEREDNDGEDPVIDVPPGKINNHKTLLFRCVDCYRGCHLHHLPINSRTAISQGQDEEELGAQLFEEYKPKWKCNECMTAPGQVESLVAWRPNNVDTYQPGQSTEMLQGDMQAYLVKWKKLPYIDSKWMPGDWVWGITASATRKAFMKRDNVNNMPRMTTEEAIPEDFMRVDIVFEVEYSSVYSTATEKIAKERIKDVIRALVKFKGLGYEDVVWIEPPSQENAERRADFEAAYEELVSGTFIYLPVKEDLNKRLRALRVGGIQNFKTQVVLENQPEILTGGELMSYQLEGLNWIYYQWYRKQNAILGDEMGLGKTIQVIGFMAALMAKHSCWPFLVVVPNSTCPNWRREIKQWAPSLRVVTYYGSAQAKKLSAKHELFPRGDKNLACHVVITSYDAAQETEFQSKFREVKWAGLIVDEGQRLKSDRNILYGALNALKAPFKLLLTGTPLQNNARELFNLLQFLDHSVNAQEMEKEYATLTEENIAELHTRLREMFLRRTKAEVLDFLPPMAQIILPVSMSVLQKELYKSILEKNPDLMMSIIGAKDNLGKKERANLNNLMMQLRKCLAHPFVYSKAIETRTPNATQSHRHLVDASSKLQLLEIMLPKLQERGHRVLIFSQFLDMLDIVEDFLDGLGLSHQRLDGSMGSLQKQRLIDNFNRPNSNIFAFMLSTRAGGVGINLATADTVIILDPDWNPHQDIQALSRAHRIGQKKKVLIFQMTTRNSAEEKMMQVGKKKMALDHLMIEQMDADDDTGLDVQSILKHGADALFKGDDTQDIKYDSASVDRLLDRSLIEDTKTDNDKTAESQFSFARVWANDKGTLEDGMDMADGAEPDPSVWEAILKERAREVAEAAAAKKEESGRGKRKRQTIDYSKQIGHGHASSPAGRKGKGRAEASDSDTDFMERGEESDDAVDSAEEDVHDSAVSEQQQPAPTRRRSRPSVPQVSPKGNNDSGAHEQQQPAPPRRRSRPSVPRASPKGTKVRAVPAWRAGGKRPAPTFKRAEVPVLTPGGIPLPPANGHSQQNVQGFNTVAHPTDSYMHHNNQGYNYNRTPLPPMPQNYYSPHNSLPPTSRPPPGPPSNIIVLDGANDQAEDLPVHCVACGSVHHQGYCPLKQAGVEHCGLCGLAHYGYARTCPHVNSVTQCRAMLDALKYSPEPQALKDSAKKRITGIIGDLNQRRRKAEEAKQQASHNQQAAQHQQAPQYQSPYIHPTNGHAGHVNGAASGNGNQAPPPFEQHLQPQVSHRPCSS